MSKPLKEFGGWLRFFQVINMVNVTLMFVVVIVSMMAMISVFTLENGVRGMLELAQASFMLFLSANIIKSLPDPAPGTPKKIQQLILRLIITFAAFHVAKFPLLLFFKDTSPTAAWWTYITDPLSIALWYFSWILYFQRAKRVKAYYIVEKNQ